MLANKICSLYFLKITGMTNITIETWEEKVFVGERATVSLKELATQFGKSLPMMGNSFFITFRKTFD